MRLNLFTEHRYRRTPDGRIWSALYPASTWHRYLEVFDHVRICSRVMDTAKAGSEFVPAADERVTIRPLPYYHGPSDYMARRRTFRKAVHRAVSDPEEAVIVRVPGQVATVAEWALHRQRRPLAIEVLADPWDMYSRGSSSHPLRAYFRRSFARALRRQCRRARISLYVTESALQRSYPPAHASHAVSDVQLPPSGFAPTPRPPEAFLRKPLAIICVGSFNLLYKGQDVLVRAFSEAVAHGLNATLTFVGDGIYRARVESLARTLADGKRPVPAFRFLGQLPGGAAVRRELDAADLFVLASRQEGLPRAVVEAMARGLPCVGTTVGGFPELLPPECLIEPGKVAPLSALIRKLAADPAALSAASARNLQRARDFSTDRLLPRHAAFLRSVRDVFAPLTVA